MFLAINILALLLVLGMCWFAMVWYSGRFHGRVEEPEDELHYVALPVDEAEVEAGAPCVVCEGVGARPQRGRVIPCEQCQGTGVVG